MKKRIHLIFASCLIAFLSSPAYGQAADSLISSGMTADLRNDTLFFSTGLKIVPGQKLTVGNPGGEDGRYRSIISRKAAVVPSIWGQDTRFENAIENYVDSKKDRERLRKSLVPGVVVTVKKSVFLKTGKPYFYIALLDSGTDGYKCDMKLALVLKELVLQ